MWKVDEMSKVVGYANNYKGLQQNFALVPFSHLHHPQRHFPHLHSGIQKRIVISSNPILRF